jgi:hypothetical protein
MLASLSPTLVASSALLPSGMIPCLAVEECGQSASAFNPDVPREVVRAKNITKSRPVVEEESAKHGFRCGS